MKECAERAFRSNSRQKDETPLLASARLTGCRFIPNIRLGAREQKILTYCLDEARRCAPHILILLGDRYGYVPTCLGCDRATGRDN